LDNFSSRFGDQDLQSVTPDQILTFPVQITEGQKQGTKRFKYILLKTLFNFIKNSTDPSFVNPCDSSILKKTFRHSIQKASNGPLLKKMSWMKSYSLNGKKPGLDSIQPRFHHFKNTLAISNILYAGKMKNTDNAYR
jgi:hypothetical protein